MPTTRTGTGTATITLDELSIGGMVFDPFMGSWVVKPREPEIPKKCEHCGKVLTDDEALYFDGDYYCTDCLDELTVICEICNNRHWLDDTTCVGDSVICDHCLERHFVRCEDCGEYVDRYNSVYICDGNYSVCEHCFDYGDYGVCDDCGEAFTRDYLIYDEYDDCYYCERCERYHNRIIHEYNYKPDPTFFGDDSEMYMGIELEIDKGGENDDNAEILLNTVNSFNANYLYAKHDGSLDYGFELVSHPATLNQHLSNIKWDKLMDKAVELGYRSHNTSSCGLHIHISREALGVDENEREYTIAKIIYFVSNNWDNILTFTRRNAGRMERWASRYGIINDDVIDTYENAKIDNHGWNGTRYKCINLQNNATVEFRMFRGTLKYNTFVATLQFVDEVVKQCMQYSDEEIAKLSWIDFISKIENKPELIAYLEERGLM